MSAGNQSILRRQMNHGIYKIVAFEVMGPYTLRISFDDGVDRTIDFRPVLAGELYQPLLDLSLFNQVRIDPEVFTLVWPNGADFEPATLHDWPELKDKLVERAKKWESVEV